MTSCGLIDVHNHLLPGIDDGCASLDESIASAQRLLAAGFTGAVCTPHVCVGDYAENTPAAIDDHVVRLQEAFREAAIDFPLWSGAEVRISAATIDWFEQYGVPTLGNGRAVLVDFWGPEWEPFCSDVVDYLFQRGYQPVLAHPERMPLAEDDLERLLDELQEQGVLLQGNLRCAAGGEGSRAYDRIHGWLAKDRYFLLATDMHRPDSLEARLQGIASAEQTIGHAKLLTLISTNAFKTVLSSSSQRLSFGYEHSEAPA